MHDPALYGTPSKAARRLNYTQKRRAGLIESKPRCRINPIAKKRVTKMRKYTTWIKTAIKGQKCAFPNCPERFFIEPHHPSGRHGNHLFEVIPCCSLHHLWIHTCPDAAFKAGWLTPAYRGYAPNPNHPQPFTLLPPP